MRVLVAMSGGLDSSVVAALLKKQGHECIGIHLQFWSDPKFMPDDNLHLPQNKCCSREALETARQVCAKLDMPFYVLNFRENFYKTVVKNFLKKYQQGVTPNPCVICNRQIKFGLLLKRAKELNCDFVASGHYVRKSQISSATTNKSQNNKCPAKSCGSTGSPCGYPAKSCGSESNIQLFRGKDKDKDQSYFLYTLTQEKLKHILFPLGEFKKTEVKKMAQDFGLDFFQEKKESQGVCFFPEEIPANFLQRHLPKKYLQPGPIVSTDGKDLKQKHAGLPLYTIGQRRGIKIGGVAEPLYVIRLDLKNNALIVGSDTETYSNSCVIKNLHFIAKEPPKNLENLTVQIRYRAPTVPVKVEFDLQKKSACINFLTPQRAITPGQALVFYEGEKVIGGGEILESNK